MIRRVGFVACMLLLFFALQRLVVPKYADTPIEGGLIGAYYSSTKSHDIIFIGHCVLYAGFSPAVLWEEFGITSHVRASPLQRIWQSYYLLHDTLRFEVPQVMVLSVMPMRLNTNDEPYNRLTLDGMRWSRHKFGAIRASMTDEETWLTYLFPFFRFKARWSSLSRYDVRYYFRQPRTCINGFIVRADVNPAGFLPRPSAFAPPFDEKPIRYLDRIADLAENNGIRLVLLVDATLYPFWHDAWDAWVRDFANERGITYMNFRQYRDEIGIDFQTDTLNAGLHLNVFGAIKQTRFFGERLPYEIHREHSPEVVAHFDGLVQLQNYVIARQIAEIERYGQVKTLLH